MSKNKKKTRFSLDEKIQNSKFDFCKNMKWFLIAPLAIIIVGIVMLCTLGFNLGIDFTGSSNMTIYTNSEGTYSEFESYDLDTDMGKLKEKINGVLSEFGLSVNTIQKTTITDSNLGIYTEDAVIVKYQNDSSKDESGIEADNDQIHLALLKAFGYVDEGVNDPSDLEGLDEAGFVTNGGFTTASGTIETVMKSVIAFVVALAVALIYLIFRFGFVSSMTTFLALVHDLLITAAVMVICRIEINISFIAALFTVLCFSIYNSVMLFSKVKENLKVSSQANQKIDNKQIANSETKSNMSHLIFAVLVMFIIIFMITILGFANMGEFTFSILVGTLATFYSCGFMSSGLWAIAYKPRKKKKNVQQSKSQKEDVVEIAE